MSEAGGFQFQRRHAKTVKFLLVIFALLLAACAGNGHHQSDANPASAVVKPQPEKELVTDANGLTVYVHDPDPPLKSRCDEGCVKYWRPVRPSADFSLGGKFSVIMRQDGSQQLAYNNRPLYTFVNDTKPGDKKGDGKEGKWHALYY